MSQQRIYYSEESRKQAQRQTFVLAMAVAGVSLSLGAVIALLFAPTTGDNIRREIRDYLDELADQGKQVADNLEDTAQQNARKARKQIENL